MNLIIDIGNTRIKAGLAEQNEIKHFFVFDNGKHTPVFKEFPEFSGRQKQADGEQVTPPPLNEAVDEFVAADLFEKFSVKHCIIGSVVDNMGQFINQLKEKAPTLVFTSETPVPLVNLYRTAHTLGGDRLAAAAGGVFLFPGKNVLIIDAGTCIKYNFVNKKKEYLGGAISPGLQMRFKALHTFTSRLPLLTIDESFNTLIGTNSNESILSGVEIGTIAETEGLIEKYRALYPDVNVVLTGGDTYFFEKRLKSRIFTDSLLIMKGLNAILEHNLQG